MLPALVREMRVALARLSLLIAVGWLLLVPPAAGQTTDGDLCAAAIRAVERTSPLPQGLLGAVSFAEAGRRDPDRPRAVAWPWTVNNAGDGRYFATKREAIAHVEALRGQGKRNIDVGCMQINLMHHPDAFASLEAAFEPSTNVAYGAGFLEQLKQETGSWGRAIERYHTADPARGQAYRTRVFDRWQDVRLADATGAGAKPASLLAAGTRSPNGRAAGLALAGKPRVPPPRRELASLRGRGSARVAPAPAKIALLRPPRGRSTIGLVRTDGRIAGSLLRLGPRRSALGGAPERKSVPADPRRDTAEQVDKGMLAAERPLAAGGAGPRLVTDRDDGTADYPKPVTDCQRCERSLRRFRSTVGRAQACRSSLRAYSGSSRHPRSRSPTSRASCRRQAAT